MRECSTMFNILLCLQIINFPSSYSITRVLRRLFKEAVIKHIYIYTHIYTYTQGVSKRWTQVNIKRRLNTRQTAGCDIPSSLLALQVDLRGLHSKLS